MATRALPIVMAILLLSGLTPVSRAQDSDGPSLEEMANKANNPLSDVWLLIVENDTSTLRGDDVPGTKVSNATLIEPVMPVPVFDQKWNLIFRPIIPILSSPLDKKTGFAGNTAGLGDSVLLTLLGPNRNDGFVWGMGPTFVIPTATDGSFPIGMST